jgi:hypothetical protein
VFRQYELEDGTLVTVQGEEPPQIQLPPSAEEVAAAEAAVAEQAAAVRALKEEQGLTNQVRAGAGGPGQGGGGGATRHVRWIGSWHAVGRRGGQGAVHTSCVKSTVQSSQAKVMPCGAACSLHPHLHMCTLLHAPTRTLLWWRPWRSSRVARRL